MVFADLLVLAVGLAILLKGADVFVEYASRLARFLGVPQLVIGLTIVAVGTSLPELATSVFASLSGNPAIALGNVLGSNVANILLILGLSGALFGPLEAPKRVFQKDCFIMVAVTGLFYVAVLDGRISGRQGLFFLLLFLLYSLVALRARFAFPALFDFRAYLRAVYPFPNGLHMPSTPWPAVAKGFRSTSMLVIGLVGVVYGAQLLVGSAERLALTLNLADEFLAMTLIAIGTSLPEAAVSLTAVRKKLPAIALGNIIGSNIANLLLVLGAAALTAPLQVNLGELRVPFIFMLGSSLLLLLLVNSQGKISRHDAVFFLLVFVLFLFSIAKKMS